MSDDDTFAEVKTNYILADSSKTMEAQTTVKYKAPKNELAPFEQFSFKRDGSNLSTALNSISSGYSPKLLRGERFYLLISECKLVQTEKKLHQYD